MNQGLTRKLENAIREAILSSRLIPGQTLPGLRQLPEAFGVPEAGMATARAAVAKLQKEGLVAVLPRSGVKVLGPETQPIRTTQGHIGVLVPELGDSFSRLVLDGILEAAGSRRDAFTVIVGYTASRPEIEALHLKGFIADGVRGIVAFPAHERANEQLYLWCATQIPVVFCDRRTENLDLPCIRHDNYQGGHLAATHMLRDAKHGSQASDRGCVRRLYLLLDRETSSLEDRARGIESGFREWASRFPTLSWHCQRLSQPVAGAKDETEIAIKLIDELLAEIDPSWNPGRPFKKTDLLKDVGIIGLHEKLALPAYDYLEELEIKCPQHLIFMSYDDLASRSRGITSIRQLPREMGADAVRTLIDRIEGKPRDRRREAPRPVKLIVRTSTGGYTEPRRS